MPSSRLQIDDERSRHSPRNRLVARVLDEAGLATLLFDLLSEEEEQLDRRTANLRLIL